MTHDQAMAAAEEILDMVHGSTGESASRGATVANALVNYAREARETVMFDNVKLG